MRQCAARPPGGRRRQFASEVLCGNLCGMADHEIELMGGALTLPRMIVRASMLMHAPCVRRTWRPLVMRINV